jgi:hypothetical protein
VFDPYGKPCSVVKIGVSARARELIRAEASVLEKLPQHGSFFPRLHKRHESDLSAICMEYVAGKSPQSPELIGATLTPWLQSGELRTIGEFAKWQRLSESDAPQQTIASLEEVLRSTPLCVALEHGDFAPWNIREHLGKWTVIDWERGEMRGVPGWDWFHYIIQTQVLVGRRSPAEVLRTIMKTIARPDFQSYATRAGFSGKEMPLLAGYLLNAIYVTRQTEGDETLKALLGLVGV